MNPGTEVILEREAAGDDIERLVRTAVLRDAPFLTRRGKGEVELPVFVNNMKTRAGFDLPSPSMEFRGRGIRGAVGLGRVARVEIFVHGLRVREAASFDDLLLTGRRGRAGPPIVSDELAPQAVIDSSSLTVLLARGDAREDRALRRLVATGHRELRRLIRAELDRCSRPSLVARGVEWVREAWAAYPIPVAACVGLLVVLSAYSGLRMAAGDPTQLGPFAENASSLPVASAPPNERSPYTDVGRRYRGPDADALGPSLRTVDLAYRPPGERRFFAALVMTGLSSTGEPSYPASSDAESAASPPCLGGCLEVELSVETDEGILRLPLPTGFEVEAGSVRLEGTPVPIIGGMGGLPAVDLGDRRSGRVTYRCAEASGAVLGPSRRWPMLPQQLADPVREIARLPLDARARAAEDLVRRVVRYDASEATAERHREERGLGLGLFERSLRVGAGDCDVQNAMVAAILNSVEVPARLAVGWVGEAGAAVPGLHAWVEYLGSDGVWRVADASTAGGAGRSRPVDPPSEHAPGGGVGEFLPWAAGGAVLLALLSGVGLYVASSGHSRAFKLDDRPDVADLVRAAVVHPEAFAGTHALFTRRVVPVLHGSPISIERARAAASKGMLSAGGSGNDLAVRAALRGTVIDIDTAEGAAVAGALGAVDLDAWQHVLEDSSSDPLLERARKALAEAGEPCRLRVARTAGEEIAVLDGSRLGLPRAERWVVLDRSGGTWQAAHELAARHPSAADLLLVESVCRRLGLPSARSSALLALLARAALDERSGGSG
jgi:transglutaminase-like putative cysteine protease